MSRESYQHGFAIYVFWRRSLSARRSHGSWLLHWSEHHCPRRLRGAMRGPPQPLATMAEPLSEGCKRQAVVPTSAALALRPKFQIIHCSTANSNSGSPSTRVNEVLFGGNKSRGRLVLWRRCRTSGNGCWIHALIHWSRCCISNSKW